MHPDDQKMLLTTAVLAEDNAEIILKNGHIFTARLF